MHRQRLRRGGSGNTQCRGSVFTAAAVATQKAKAVSPTQKAKAVRSYLEGGVGYPLELGPLGHPEHPPLPPWDPPFHGCEPCSAMNRSGIDNVEGIDNGAHGLRMWLSPAARSP